MFRKYLWILLISMLPIIELRGAIPVAVTMELDIVPTFIISVLANFLPVPFILLFIRKILDWMETTKTFGKIARWVRRKADKSKHKIVGAESKTEDLSENESSAESNTAEENPSTDVAEAEINTAQVESDGTVARKKRSIMKSAAVGLFLFVAIPLPGTGAWTGALIASLVDMRMKYALPAIFLGVIAAGVIMSLASFGVVGIFNFLL